MIFGYARVSTDDQLLDAQTDALTAACAERIFAEKISGAARNREVSRSGWLSQPDHHRRSRDDYRAAGRLPVR
jgi:hypothetical protein